MFNPDLLYYLPVSFFILLGAGVALTVIMLAIEHKIGITSPQLAAYEEMSFAEALGIETPAEPTSKSTIHSAYTSPHWYLAPLLATDAE